jgi:hypothetical protein
VRTRACWVARTSCARRGGLRTLGIVANLWSLSALCRSTGPTPQQAPCAVPPLRSHVVPHPALAVRVVRVPRDGHAPVRVVNEGAAAAHGRHGTQQAPQDDAAALQEWLPRGHAGEEDDGQECLSGVESRFPLVVSLFLCVCVPWCAGARSVCRLCFCAPVRLGAPAPLCRTPTPLWWGTTLNKALVARAQRQALGSSLVRRPVFEEWRPWLLSA